MDEMMSMVQEVLEEQGFEWVGVIGRDGFEFRIALFNARREPCLAILDILNGLIKVTNVTGNPVN